jgi:hypothetical protein
MRTRSNLFPIGMGIAVSALVASCGGGGGDGTGSEAIPPNTARLDCQVADRSTGAAVADASISYQARTTEYTTQTKPDGSCRLDLPAAEVAGVQYPAASVTKPGYEPQTILCASLQGGSACSQDVQMIPLAANVSIPVGGDMVMHLGDDLFEGSVNSQFQKASDGVELVFPIADWAEQLKAAGITKATVYLDAKGWQSGICSNLVALSGDTGTLTLRGGESPAQGYWAGGKQVPFVFAVAQVGSRNAELRITSGSCNGTSDFDDFEINRIRVEFS